MKMNKITANILKEYVAWLRKENCGCCHFRVADTENKEIDIVVGWHNYGDGPKEDNYDNWVVCWKIGMQSFNNGMQTDMDIDFDMPYDIDSGEVYDSLDSINENVQGFSWAALANAINRTAVKVYRFQKEQERKEEEYAA